MSVKSLGEPIAGTPNLYAWGKDQLVKLFGDEAPEDPQAVGVRQCLEQLCKNFHLACFNIRHMSNNKTSCPGCQEKITSRLTAINRL